MCSLECALIYRATDKEYKEKLSKIQLQKVKDGTHVGWQSRKKRSYAENFFEQVLKNNDLWDLCIPEHPVSKKELGAGDVACYFLDFYRCIYIAGI